MPIPTTNEIGNVPDVYLKEQQPSYVTSDNGDRVKFLEFNKETQELYMNDPETYMPIFSREKRMGSAIFIGPGINQFTQLKELTRNLAGGPYYLDGRDGKMEVHNTKASRPVSHWYTYAGGSGELLSYRIQTKFLTTAVEAAKSTGIDPDTLEMNTEVVQALPNTEATTKDGVLHWWKTPFEETPTSRVDALRVARPLPMPINNGSYKASQTIRETGEYDEINGNRYPKAYASHDNAITDEANKYLISESDINAYMGQLRQNFETINNREISSPEDLVEMTKLLNNLDPYVIKRKVWIQRWVQPSGFGNQRVGNVGESTTPQMTGYTNAGYGDRMWKTGYDHLKSNPNMVIVPKPGTSGTGRYDGYNLVKRDKVLVLEQREVEVPINGARILSNPLMANIGTIMGNDIVETTQAQFKLEMSLVGNPSLESSMNVELRNISARYSGVYYTKKVTHRLNPSSGYICDAECNQKTVPVAVNHISASVNTQKIYSNINQVAEESLKTEAYKNPGFIKQQLEEWRPDLQASGESIIIVQDPDNLGNSPIYKANEDFSATYVHDALEAQKDTEQITIKPQE